MDERERESLIGLVELVSDLAGRLDDLAGFAGEMQPGDIAWRMRRARDKALAIHNELIKLSSAGPAPATPGRNPLPAEFKLPKHPPPGPPLADPTLPRWQPRKYDLSP